MIEWQKRFVHAIEQTNTKKIRLAEAAGGTRSNLTTWTSGGSATIDATKMLKMCDHMGVDYRWVLTGEGRMLKEKADLITCEHLSGEETAIFAKADGDSDLATWELVNERTFRPRLTEGDVLFIDRSKAQLESPRLYLLREKTSSRLFIRRYFYNFLDNKHALVDGNASESDPATYELFNDEQFTGILERVEIIGQVLGYYSSHI